MTVALDPLTWCEYTPGAELEIDNCPTCGKEVLPGFFLFRPAGLEHWRCLGCLVKTFYGGTLYAERRSDQELDQHGE